MTAIVYAICKAIIESVAEWLRSPRVVRVVGGGARVAERVRAAIRSRTRQPDVDSARQGKRARGDA